MPNTELQKIAENVLEFIGNLLFIVHKWNCHLEVFCLPQAVDSMQFLCRAQRSYL